MTAELYSRKVLGQGDSMPEGPVAASPRPEELNAPQPPWLLNERCQLGQASAPCLAQG